MTFGVSMTPLWRAPRGRGIPVRPTSASGLPARHVGLSLLVFCVSGSPIDDDPVCRSLARRTLLAEAVNVELTWSTRRGRASRLCWSRGRGGVGLSAARLPGRAAQARARERRPRFVSAHRACCRCGADLLAGRYRPGVIRRANIPKARARCSGRDRRRWPSDTGWRHRAAPVRRWRRQWPSYRACRLARRRRKPRANQPTGA
jgi:hypothetical protein